MMGLTALLLLQHARAAARLDANGAIVLLEDQDRRLWDRDADRRRRRAHRQSGASPQPGLIRFRQPSLRCIARRPRRGHRLGRDRLALCGVGEAAALSCSHPQSLGRRRQDPRTRGGSRHDRAARVAAVRLLPFPRGEGRISATARVARKRRGGSSSAPSRWPARPPRRPISGYTWTSWQRLPRAERRPRQNKTSGRVGWRRPASSWG